MLPQGTKVYFAVEPADLRKSFDGLAAMVSSVLGKDPTSGGLFVFLNKRGDQVRVLFRDRHGWCLLSKRLDRARFRRPRSEENVTCWEAEAKALMTFLEDIDFTPPMRPRRPVSPNDSTTRLSLVQSELQ